MVLVNERREILGTAFLPFFVDVRPRSVLPKGSIVPKHIIAIFEADWKHLLNNRACQSRKSLKEMTHLYSKLQAKRPDFLRKFTFPPKTIFAALFTAHIRSLCEL